MASEAAKHDTASAKGCASASAVVLNSETQLGFTAQVAIGGAGSATRGLKPSQDEWMACDLDTEFMYAACKWLFKYLNPVKYDAMAEWIGCPAPQRRLLAVGMICQLYKSSPAGNPIAIQGTEHQFLELVTFDADMKCWNGGAVGATRTSCGAGVYRSPASACGAHIRKKEKKACRCVVAPCQCKRAPVS